MAKAKARSVVDRVARPYVDEIKASGGPPSDGATVEPPGEQPEPTADGTTTAFFHMVNHELRTLELERIPRGVSTALSVGAQGGWYFKWFEDAVGPLERHIGIEAFEPEPDDLPANATWIPDTADHMQGVTDGSVDLVFAGQTSEHLWADELAGFLAESHRVLRANGLLVLDSPNRLVTEHLLWGHGGHTIELSASEMAGLLELAGFEVQTVRGLWRCRFGDRVLQLEEGLTDGPTVVRRIAEGGDNPDDAFVWWIVARRLDRAPDLDGLRQRSAALFEEHWPTRVGRGLPPFPNASRLSLAVGDSGVLGKTLPFPLHQGRWRATVRAAKGSLSDANGLEMRLVAPGGVVVQQSEGLIPAGDVIKWEFDQPYLLFALSLEISVDSVGAPLDIELPIELRPVHGS